MKPAPFALAALAALLVAAPADARPLRGGISMENLGKVLRAKGYPVELGVDEAGDPKITSTYDGVEFEVLCYPNAARKAVCASIQFSTVFNLDEGTTYERINAWNRGRRYGQGWLDEEMDPFMDMSAELERGASTELIEEHLTIWEELIGKWKEHFGQ